MMRLPCDSMMKACTEANSLPSSLAKCGLSHEYFLTNSGLATGKKNSPEVGMPPDSTT